MKIKKILFLLVFCATSFCEIRLVLTAALTPKNYNFRKQQYIKSFNTLHSYGWNNFYIVESLQKHGPTFLDQYSDNVFYATTNSSSFRNPGINECRTLLEWCEYSDFDPDDVVVKLTGRHRFISDFFLKMVKENEVEDYDAFIKFHPKKFVETVCFAMKYKHFKRMCQELDYARQERDYMALENIVYDYIQVKAREDNWKIFSVDKLYIECQLFGSTTLPNAPNKVVVK